MFNKSLFLKAVLALLGLGAMTTMAYYSGIDPANWFENFPGTVNQGDVKLPQGFEPNYPDLPNIGLAEPEITDQKLDNTCGTKVWWYDNEKNEDNVYFYRRIVGVSDFVLFKITGPHEGGSGFFGEANLPNGTYEYRVSVVSEQWGEAFSNISQPITINSDFCNDNEVPQKPLNPVLISLERFSNDTCSIRVNYQDNSPDEDGIRIYRETFPSSDMILIAELPPSDAPTGYYDDLGLAPGKYRYRVSVFHEGGESYSNYSEEFAIQDEACKTFVPPVLQLPTAAPAGDSSDSVQACVWTSSVNVFIRKGPSSTLYSDITAVVAGTSLPVVGQSENGEFWVVEVQPGVLGYVPKAERFGSTSADCNPPVLEDPALPDSGPAESPSAEEPQVPACRDGQDNDGDGYIDMRDRDCTNPDDTSE